MVNRVYIKCKLCNAVTLLRYQVGYGDIRIVIPCGSCGCELRGSCTQNDEAGSLAYQFENAEILRNPESPDPDYVGQYSRELLAEKVKPYSYEASLSFSPFIAMNGYFQTHEREGRLQNAMGFVDNELSNADDFFDLIRLWENDKLTILAKKLDEILPPPPIADPNHLQTGMRLHSLAVLYLSPLMPEDWLNRNDLFPLITSLIEHQSTEVFRCVDYFEKQNFLATSEKSLYAEIKRFLGIVPYILPAFALCDDDRMRSFLNERGMFSISFEDLKSYYQNSYEVIANCSDCLIALNGIQHRNDFTALPSTTNEIKTIYDLEKSRSKIKKIETFLPMDESFSKLISGPLYSHIRNAIGHNTVSYDVFSQIITFEDRHNGKTHTERKYLVEFAQICIENFCTCVYLLEIIYQLRRIAFARSGDTSDAAYMRYYLNISHKYDVTQ